MKFGVIFSCFLHLILSLYELIYFFITPNCYSLGHSTKHTYSILTSREDIDGLKHVFYRVYFQWFSHHLVLLIVEVVVPVSVDHVQLLPVPEMSGCNLSGGQVGVEERTKHIHFFFHHLRMM